MYCNEGVNMKHRILAVLLAVLILLCGCSAERMQEADVDTQAEESQIVVQMIKLYGSANFDPAQMQKLLDQLKELNPEAGAQWDEIMSYWKYTNEEMEIQYDRLPENLDGKGTLCLVVLGFQLEPDGSMRQELIDRLTVAKTCAEQYPDSVILCTGGGTASNNPNVTEAGAMAAWLTEQGIPQERILVEDQSQTTAENALFSYGLLKEKAPQVQSVVIVSSDYHIPWGASLFQTEFILAGEPELRVVGHAACHTANGMSNTYIGTQVYQMLQLAQMN